MIDALARRSLTISGVSRLQAQESGSAHVASLPSDLSVSAGTIRSMATESVTTVKGIVAQVADALSQTRFPSVDATWEAGVAFARRWAELGGGEQALALTPRGQECTLTVMMEPWDEKDDWLPSWGALLTQAPSRL